MSRGWRAADDPSLVLERKQAQTCAGCRLLLKSPHGGPEVACRKKKRSPAARVELTKRCEIYETGEST